MPNKQLRTEWLKSADARDRDAKIKDASSRATRMYMNILMSRVETEYSGFTHTNEFASEVEQALINVATKHLEGDQ